MNYDNIASKNFNYRKKNRFHRSLSHRIIASHLACASIIAKCLRCDCYPCSTSKMHFLPAAGVTFGIYLFCNIIKSEDSVPLNQILL